MKKISPTAFRPCVDRRRFLSRAGAVAIAGLTPAILRNSSADESNGDVNNPFFMTRGIVLVTKDLSEVGWPQIAKAAGLSTIGTHVTPHEVTKFVKTEKGQRFLNECQELGVNVEHELHAMKDLLPRELFDKNPQMFRMDTDGNRVGDYNCCVHSKEALEVICENAVSYGRILRPTTGRYFYWIDDVKPMCHCPDCRVFSDSDQALILENAIIAAMRKEDPKASLAHLCYIGTLEPPKQIKPHPGIFLEFAPIERSWAHPLKDAEAVGRSNAGRGKMPHGKTLEYLDANLEVFANDTAQVLEYWLDVSLHSNWTRPAKQLPWNPTVFRSDLETYAQRGIRHVTSFAAWIDGDYVKRFGQPEFVNEYGKGLAEYHHG